ncbi:tetratricopeptide repeat protein [Phenylobacterium sp.]|uniref:tetratricopeptide repeat protein n=1 Tax=Phenylobacterium sp. TaxID=1871053 RepID=UPI0025E92F45|nr:tetratricopeptide repeat protein [Phenylobacterium sp.]
MAADGMETEVAAAAAHLRAGRVAEAERLYSDILSRAPHHPKASHNLAVLFLQRQEVARALPLLATATAADPTSEQGWVTYIRALTLAGRFEDAEQILRERLASSPGAGELEGLFRRAWAKALVGAGDLAAAEVQLRQGVTSTPLDPDAHANLGAVQLRLGQTDAAAASAERALELAPDRADTLAGLGLARRAQARDEEAERLFRRALAIDPGNAAAVRQLGALLTKSDRFEEALACADRSLAHERRAAGLLAQGDAYFGLERFEEALASYSEALDLDPGSYEALIKMGRSRAALRDYVEALSILDRAVRLQPMEPAGRFWRSVLRLLIGDFEGGWADYDMRWRHATAFEGSGGVVTPQLRARLSLDLDLETVRGQRILLAGEQGIGDQVMFASMIPDLARVAQITCVCDGRLTRLFSASLPGVRFLDPISAELQFSDFDRVVAMGSLGKLFRNRVADFPGASYLRPRAEVCAHWRERLGPRPKGLRIGLTWRGGRPTTNMAQRSMALSQLAPLANLPDCEFVSLQYGEAQADLQAVREGLNWDIHAFPKAEIDDFEDLAGLIETLDVVVSVQNSVVHLAGAIGKDCLALVPHNPEWRYGTASAAMPWYRSVEIRRQTAPGAWAPVIADVVETLKRRRPLTRA